MIGSGIFPEAHNPRASQPIIHVRQNPQSITS